MESVFQILKNATNNTKKITDNNNLQVFVFFMLFLLKNIYMKLE